MEASDTSEPKTGWRPNWVTEGIIVGAISVFAYFLALSYETGWCEAFEIPHELITVTPLQVFRGALIYLLVFLYTLVRHGRDLLELFFPRPEKAVSNGEIPAEPIAAAWKKKRSGFRPFIAARHLAGRVRRAWTAAQAWWDGESLGATLLQALSFVGLVCAGTPGVRLPQRLFLMFLASLPPLIMYELNRRLDGFPAVRGTTRPLRFTALLLAVGIWLHVFHFCAGYLSALGQSDFHVLSGKPERVVLAIYGSHVIAAPLDRTGNHWHPPLTIQNLGDSATIQLQREQVGPLSKAVQGWPAKPIPSIPAKAPGP